MRIAPNEKKAATGGEKVNLNGYRFVSDDYVLGKQKRKYTPSKIMCNMDVKETGQASVIFSVKSKVNMDLKANGRIVDMQTILNKLTDLFIF